MLAAVTQAKHSLHTPYAAMYLLIANRCLAEAATLKLVHDRCIKDAPEDEVEALWSGAYELRKKGTEALKDATARGALLFFGQPAAIDAAQVIELRAIPKGPAC